MADEPRRSGRATKGQHKNIDAADAPAPKNTKKAAASTTAAASSNNNKKGKKSAEPEQEPEVGEEGDEEEEEEEIRCVCGDTTDNVEGRAYVSCDACSVWQHNICMGLPIQEALLPEHYMCEQCAPDDHKPLLESMARGEKLWEDRQRDHAERERQERNRKKAGKRKSKGGARQSRVSDVKSDAPASQSPAPTASQSQEPAPVTTTTTTTTAAATTTTTKNKRKFEEEPSQQPTEQVVEQPTEQAVEQPSRRQSSVAESAPKRRKSEQQQQEKGEDKVDTDTALVGIDQLPKERKGVAQALVKMLVDLVREKVTSGSYSLGQGENAESVGQHHASLIEYELFQVHGPPGGQNNYGAQFRALNANFRKNQALVQGLLDGSLTAHTLATMPTQDMASDEDKRQREQMKQEVDKQAVMVRDEDEDKPRVRRTHKGDEYIDDQEDTTHDSVFNSKPVRARTDQENAANAEAAAVGGASGASPDRMEIDGEAARRQSQQQQFDITSVWAKMPHDSDQSQAQGLPARRQSSFNKTPQEKGEKHDADVDRLLADDDADYAPPEANGVVWKGLLIQPGVTEFVACARHAAGNDFSQFNHWHEFIPPSLEIEGRLEAKRADDYLCGLQWSKKSDVSVLALTPYDNRAAFDQVYEYFATRGRYAVIKKGPGMSNIVKDVYITPIGPGHRLPPHLDLLEYNTLDPAVPERMLLMTFVVNKPAHWDNPVVLDPSAAIASPVVNGHNPAGPQFSPRPAQGFTPMQNGHQQQYPPAPMPPNPYNNNGAPPAPAYPTAAQSYPSPVAQPQQSFVSSNPLVNNILGPLAQSPVVVQILSAAGNNVGEHVLRNMRDILTSDPAAREDITIFQQRLAMMGQQHQPR